jgi:hypothetical protein
LKPKLTYDTSRNPHEDFSEDEVDSRYPNIPQDSQGDGGARRSSMVSTNPKTKRNKSLTTGKHSVGGAPPPGAFLAQSQDNLEEWFLLGLTCALVVRKRRGLSQHMWRTYQDQSINAPVYHPQRTASSRVKVYTNIKLPDATPRIEDSIDLHEGSDNPQDNKSYPRSLYSSGPHFAS